jgi:hypothetical protein
VPLAITAISAEAIEQGIRNLDASPQRRRD